MSFGQRLDGWKAIAAYLGRDRSTIMRWQRERDLPIRRVPGGKQATVYALVDELDAWIKGNEGGLEDGHALVAGRSSDGRNSDWKKWSIACFLLLALASSAYFFLGQIGGREKLELALPKDPKLTEIYVKARADWSQRMPDTIDRAIKGFEIVIDGEPNFAAGYAALADAYLLKREFGEIDNIEAFTKAKNAARTALKLDNGLAAAHRALGFAQYWGDHDPKEAGISFRRAIELAPGEAQSFHWYAAVLGDNGQYEKSMQNFAQAMALQPSLTQMVVDKAWASWEAGYEDAADNLLREAEKREPNNATIAVVRAEEKLYRGDWYGYARGMERYALIRKNNSMLAHARKMMEAGKRGGLEIAKVELAASLADCAKHPYYDYDWPAGIASLMGDRALLIDLLKKGAARKERWGSAGYRLRIANRWRGDSEVLSLLKQVEPPPVE